MGTAQATDLEALYKASAGSTTAIVAASTSELQSFKDQVKSMFNDKDYKNWQALAMQKVDYPEFILLQELPTAKRGRGVFAINKQAIHNWLLQAPHGDSDLYTGKIASRLFLTGAFKAVQWNTVHRDILDLAHEPNTYWQTFTQAFAEQYSDSKIIQIHGFDQSQRTSTVGGNTDMIVSSGQNATPQWVQQTANCLKQAFPTRVSLYPIDVQELGGTTNVQGQLLRSLGYDSFLHIEMSKLLRTELLDNADSRNKLINCL